MTLTFNLPTYDFFFTKNPKLKKIIFFLVGVGVGGGLGGGVGSERG